MAKRQKHRKAQPRNLESAWRRAVRMAEEGIREATCRRCPTRVKTDGDLCGRCAARPSPERHPLSIATSSLQWYLAWQGDPEWAETSTEKRLAKTEMRRRKDAIRLEREEAESRAREQKRQDRVERYSETG